MGCIWDRAWIGPCGKPTVDPVAFCVEHTGKECCSCGGVADRECPETGIQFVCGYPLCSTCRHGVPEVGKEGWFGLGGGHVTAEEYKKQCDSVVADDSSASKRESIDLVVTKKPDGTYTATGGPGEAIFCGEGRSSDEAVGAWFRSNREAVGFKVSFIEGTEFTCSTVNGVARSREELGPNELDALETLEQFGVNALKNAPDGATGWPCEPCTCHEQCPYDCIGECGCKSCYCDYQDFLSGE